jgi:enoyl-[acyl-carrier protein] reductase I
MHCPQGPVLTRAASGIAHFDTLIDAAATRSPQHSLVSIEDIGAYAAFLVSDAARHVTGDTAYIDAGDHIMS